MTDRILINLYLDLCKELSLREVERREFWFAISEEIERVHAALPDPEHATDEDIDAACERVGVTPIRTLAERAQRGSGIIPFPGVSQRGGEDPRELLVRHWQDVSRIVAYAQKRLRASEELADAVESRVKEKLFANDCAIVRKYQHKSSFRAYLQTIVARAFADIRIERSGKWHASAEAERRGPLAVALEKMIYHQHYAPGEAISVLLTSHPEASRAELENHFAALPARQSRASEVAADESTRSVAGINPDVLDVSGERLRVSRRVAEILTAFIDHLDDEDALLLQFIFEDGLPMSAIAPRLNKNQQSLYRRRDQLFAQLREILNKAGITRAEAGELYDTIAKTVVFTLAKKER